MKKVVSWSHLQRVHGILVVAGFVLLLGSLTIAAALDVSVVAWGLLAAGLLAYGVAIPVTVREMRIRKPPADRPVSPSPHAATDSDVDDLMAPQLRDEQVAFFVECLLAPQHVISRLHERISPATRALEFQSTAHLARRSGQSSVDTYVPINVLKKGRLIDDLRVSGQDGTDLPLLGFKDGLALIAAVLDRLVSACGPSAARSYRDNHRRLVMAALARPATRKAQNDQHTVRREMNDRAAWLSTMRTDLGNVLMADVVVAIVDLLSRHYCQIVMIPAGVSDKGPYSISVSYRRIHDLQTPSGFGSTTAILGHMRSLLGVRPNSYTISLQNAARTSSYHMEFMGPRNTYLARHGIVRSEDTSKTEQFVVGQHGDYVRLRRRRGQRYAHVYIRGGTSRIQQDRLSASLTFFERTPGSVGDAAVVAIASTILIAGAGYVIANQDATASDADLMSVLLSAPIAASSWLGLQRETIVAGGILGARLGNIITAVISTAAALGALGLSLGGVMSGFPSRVFASSGWLGGQVQDLALIGLEGGWALLLILSICNTFALLFSWGRRSLIYGMIIGQDDPSDED
ncbi:hypothetical protein F4692_001538 [Nocardioides cavernae]|uniref:Uncharacterized protein n=1 Tax=Nocardioides cavernae TaxID=1921566 RepID=A0A7Y9H225_9ACTN|nr:hypothetical protein [Nocardioides cavernae]NYE36405.1 hypothetical protein [Nocardioides cavernae]